MAKPRRRQMAEINVVPYIDVMLVLLVIFMITAPLITQGVSVDLPEAESEPVSSEQEIAVINIDRSGNLFFTVGADTTGPLEFEELLTMVRAQKEVKPHIRFALGGDRYTEYGNVVKVFVALKKGGIENVALMTDDSALGNGKRK
ncbi:protein TolR [Permianibacter aggregans]|uniref:Tol-Pal system protein TolR n=1 Tax=Permianibacter aggregans TaxID=1510150 RepID=A0A4R6UQY7_9GAMM|nr:protein TolR [Permianibacter aggregans]QGX41085.1 protein TolR [Permianibacter aggregans]TDQ48149.1 cell division and transport-associated protein TolR [Permianibacter aggregans]